MVVAEAAVTAEAVAQEQATRSAAGDGSRVACRMQAMRWQHAGSARRRIAGAAAAAAAADGVVGVRAWMRTTERMVGQQATAQSSSAARGYKAEQSDINPTISGCA